MKILIAYASKTGSTREMAQMLAEHLPNQDVTLCDLSEKQVDPAAFDYVVIGGPIRMNRAHKALRSYVAKYERTLCEIPHTLFLCCAFSEQFDHYLRVSFTSEIIQTAEDAVYFGGDLSLSRQRGLVKLLTRMIRNSILESEDERSTLPCLLPEHVRLLADRLRKK